MIYEGLKERGRRVRCQLAAPALAFVAIAALLFNPNTANAVQKELVDVVAPK